MRQPHKPDTEDNADGAGGRADSGVETIRSPSGEDEGKGNHSSYGEHPGRRTDAEDDDIEHARERA